MVGIPGKGEELTEEGSSADIRFTDAGVNDHVHRNGSGDIRSTGIKGLTELAYKR